MTDINFKEMFTLKILSKLFPIERVDNFFEALFGDVQDGAYDINLTFDNYKEKKLYFGLKLLQRPDKCLSCSLTYGLPEVFSKHPIINLNGLMDEINVLLEGKAKCIKWELGHTKTINNETHMIPLVMTME